MRISRETLVVKLGGFNTNIKFGILLNIFSELFEIDYQTEIIKELNEEDEFFVDDMFLVSIFSKDKNILECVPCSNQGNEEFIRVLEKVFGDKFYYMRSDRLLWNIEEEKIKDSDLYSFSKKTFVSNSIESNEESVLNIITKDHDYDEVREIDESNFLSKDEKILFNRLENQKIEKYFDAKYEYYYMRKKDFNVDKWWLGWTSEDD